MVFDELYKQTKVKRIDCIFITPKEVTVMLFILCGIVACLCDAKKLLTREEIQQESSTSAYSELLFTGKTITDMNLQGVDADGTRVIIMKDDTKICVVLN